MRQSTDILSGGMERRSTELPRRYGDELLRQGMLLPILTRSSWREGERVRKATRRRRMTARAAEKWLSDTPYQGWDDSSVYASRMPPDGTVRGFTGAGGEQPFSLTRRASQARETRNGLSM